jgi:hypothetical protein
MSQTMIANPSELIDHIGAAKLAEMTGKELGAIRQAKFRNRIPRSWWIDIAEAYPEFHRKELERIDANGGRASEAA